VEETLQTVIELNAPSAPQSLRELRSAKALHEQRGRDPRAHASLSTVPMGLDHALVCHQLALSACACASPSFSATEAYPNELFNLWPAIPPQEGGSTQRTKAGGARDEGQEGGGLNLFSGSLHSCFLPVCRSESAPRRHQWDTRSRWMVQRYQHRLQWQ